MAVGELAQAGGLHSEHGLLRAARFLLLAAVACAAACGGGGTATTSPPPSVDLTASTGSAFVGQPLTLRWSSNDAATCNAGGAWSGSEPVNGSARVTPGTAGTLTYLISCTGPGGTTSASATVIASTPAISVSNTFTANAVTISTSEGAPYGDCNFWLQQCGDQSNLGYGPTKVMRVYICLTGKVNVGQCSTQPPLTGPIPAQMLSDIETGLAFYEGSGMRVMPRFIYNFGPIGSTAQDAPLAVILNHIDQLAPILLRHKDIIFALEAGFIGTWGEWHDSTNGNDSAGAHAAVLDKELGYFGGIFPILERYPATLIQYANGQASPSSRLGLHDDYYASSASDGSTWDTCITPNGYCLPNVTPAQLQSFAAQVSTTSMFIGEFGELYPTLQGCAALDDYSLRYHLQSIAMFIFPQTIGPELVNEGCALSFFNKVGTRIELQKVAVIGNPTANGQLYVGVTLANTGYGRVVRQRPATILLQSGNTTVATFPLPLPTMDLTQLASGASPLAQTFEMMLTLPAGFPAGQTISAVLLVPDPAPSLQTQARYALPLNSLDASSTPIFDSTTGYNHLATFQSQ